MLCLLHVQHIQKLTVCVEVGGWRAGVVPWRPSQLKVKARTFFAEVKLLSRDATGGEWVGEGDGVCAGGVLWGVQRARQNQELNYSMSAKRAHNHTEVDRRCKLAGRAGAASRARRARFLLRAIPIILLFFQGEKR